MPRPLTISVLLLLPSLLLLACASSVVPQNAAPPLDSTTESTTAAVGVDGDHDTTPSAMPQPVSPYPAPPDTPAAPATTVYPEAASGDEAAGDGLRTRVPGAQGNLAYLPFAGAASVAPPPTAEPTSEPVPTLDFAALQANLQGQGQELGFVKTGFHVTLPEDRTLLDDWMTRLDTAGVPIFLKTVDNAEPLYKAQELMRASGVPHVLVFRATGSVPNYELPPAQAAQQHWQMHRDLFPPELDPSLVWIETLNEPDRTNAEWLAQFATETAQLAMADGFRWAAFGWAAGEPEPEHWRGPAMQEFLRLAGENPERVAIALHEYSYLEEDIGHEYPFKIGRFQELFRVADELGIPRPTVLITEWGWEYADIPPVDEAIEDVRWAAELYAGYPQVKGAAIWNLGTGCCFGDISEQVQELIDPLTELSLTSYFTLPAGKQPVNAANYQP
jgi:hypothetical protein